MDGGAWWAAVHGVAKSRTRLSDFIFAFHFHALEKEMATHSMFLPGESQGRGSLVGCRLWVAQSRTRLKRLSSSSSITVALIIVITVIVIKETVEGINNQAVPKLCG